MSVKPMSRTMPAGDMRAVCEESSRGSLHAGARLPARRITPKEAEDAKAASWFSAGVAAYPKAEAYASEEEVSSGVLTELRQGKRSVALRRLIPMLDHPPSALAFCRSFLAEVKVSEHPNEVLELCTELLEEINYVARPKKPTLTRAELAEMLLQYLLHDGSTVMLKFVENAAKAFGHDEKQVALVLHQETTEP